MTGPKVVWLESYAGFYVRADALPQTRALTKLLSDPGSQRDDGLHQPTGAVLKGRGREGEKVPQ